MPIVNRPVAEPPVARIHYIDPRVLVGGWARGVKTAWNCVRSSLSCRRISPNAPFPSTYSSLEISIDASRAQRKPARCSFGQLRDRWALLRHSWRAREMDYTDCLHLAPFRNRAGRRTGCGSSEALAKGFCSVADAMRGVLAFLVCLLALQTSTGGQLICYLSIP